jgi:hypothetical protein
MHGQHAFFGKSTHAASVCGSAAGLTSPAGEAGGAKPVAIDRHATSSSTRHKSLFACFSSEKEDSCSLSEEKDVHAVGVSKRALQRRKRQDFIVRALPIAW